MYVYISGPMILHNDLNLKAFDDAEEKLRKLGHVVASPAVWSRMDKEEEVSPAERLKAYPRYLRRDFKYLLDVDAIVMLPDWQRSTGATFEMMAAFFLNIPVYTLDSFIAHKAPLFWQGDETREIMEMTNAGFLSCLAIVDEARKTKNHPKSTWREETVQHHRMCAIGHLNMANRQLDPADKYYRHPEAHGAEGTCRSLMASANDIMRGEVPEVVWKVI